MASEENPIEMDSSQKKGEGNLESRTSTFSDERNNDVETKTEGDIQDHDTVCSRVSKCRTFAGMKITDCFGKDVKGWVKVEHRKHDEASNAISVTVDLYFRKEFPTDPLQLQHGLYLIFAHNSEGASKEASGEDKKTIQHLKEMRKFARKSHMPCQLAIQKVLFFDEKVVIHKTTANETIQELIQMGFQNFIRGDLKNDEDELEYFQRMYYYLSDKFSLPTFISLCKGDYHADTLLRASKNRIPVIFFKKTAKDVNILTTKEEKNNSFLATEYKIELKNPWKVTDAQRQCSIEGYKVEGEITMFSEMPHDFENMPALISNMLIGVYMHDYDDGKRRSIFGKNSDIYPNALSMYLLRTGKWKMPKSVLEKKFNKQSIDFVYEEKMTKELWTDLELKTGLVSLVQKWTKKEMVKIDQNNIILRLGSWLWFVKQIEGPH